MKFNISRKKNYHAPKTKDLNRKRCGNCTHISITDSYGGSSSFLCILDSDDQTEVAPEGYCDYFEPALIYKMMDGSMVGKYKSGWEKYENEI